MMRDALDRVTPQILRAAVEAESCDFQDRALMLIKSILPFDTAIWSTLALVGENYEVRHTRCLDRAAKMCLVHDHLPDDSFARALIIEPGRSFIARSDDSQIWAVELLRRLDEAGIGSALGTCVVQAKTGLAHTVILYRNQNAATFSEPERQLKEALTPHLADGQRQNRLIGLRRDLLSSWAETHFTATADRYGVLYDAEDCFVDLLLTEWPDWRGAALPESLVERFRNGPLWRYYGQQIALYAEPMEETCLMIATRLSSLVQLGQREREVAGLFAQGMTYKAIAQQLSITPATVRDHVAHVYCKLGVSNKTELLKHFDEASGQFGAVDHLADSLSQCRRVAVRH